MEWNIDLGLFMIIIVGILIATGAARAIREGYVLVNGI
jgi:hypothetical protein